MSISELQDGGKEISDVEDATTKEVNVGVAEESPIAFSPKVAARVLRKIDFFFMPAMIFGTV